MKKKLLIGVIALTTAFAAPTMAQSSSSYSDYFSVRAGVNFSDLRNSEFYSESQTGVNAAILYNTPLIVDMPLYLQTGLGFEMKGARNSGLLPGILNSHFKSYQLEVPMVLTYDIPIGTNTAIVPMLGIYYSFALSGTLEGEGISIDPYEKLDYEFEDGNVVNTRMMQRSDIGIRAGVGFRYSRGVIGFSYDSGMMNIFAKEFRDWGAKAFSGTCSINLEYRFNR